MATSSDSTESSSPQHKFTVEDADRLLQLGDQFLADWEENEGKDDPDCKERRAEWNAIRPLLVSAPDLLKALQGCLEYIEQNLAHQGKLLNSEELRAETQRIRETVSQVQTGFYWGPLATADLKLARSAISSAMGAAS